MTGAAQVRSPSEGRYHFYCGCGFVYHGDDFENGDQHESLSCCNCGGRECMDCVCRVWHDDCRADCPSCCPEDEA